MHILITGGTGLIGSALCEALLAEGHRLTVLTRSQRQNRGDLRFIAEFSQCTDPVDAVINLAGAGLADRRWTPAYKREIRASRVDLTDDLVAWMSEQKTPPKRLISGSAIGFYGADAQATFTEDAALGSGFSAELCHAWEAAAATAVHAGIEVTCLRLGVVLAREGGALGKMTQSFRLGMETWLGAGDQWFSWVHLEDVVRVILYALTAPSVSPVYNTVAPEPVRHRQFAREVGARSFTLLSAGVPAFVARLLAGEMADELLLSGQHVVPAQLANEGFTFRFPTLAEALSDLL
jgi:uncharacterized protein (TIGR01777 family)